MAWNEDSVSYLKKELRKNRIKALAKGKKDGAMAFEIIDFLSKNAGTKFHGPFLAEKLHLKDTKSLGAYLKAQTKLMKDLDFTDEEIYEKNSHAWFVDWEKHDKSHNYWLSKEKSKMWENYPELE